MANLQVVVNKRERIRQRVMKMTARYFPELQFSGRLPGYRYCFTELCTNDPLPLYRHLVVRHLRKSKLLKSFWSYSLFPEYRREAEGTGFSESSGKLELEVTKNADYLAYFVAIRELHERVGSKLREEQDQDDSVHGYLWNLFKGESWGEEPPEAVAKLCRLLVSTKGFQMSQPRALRVAGFVADLVPEGAVKEEGKFSLEAGRARSKLADFQLSNPQEFVVHLISGAIAGGADKVSLYVDSDDIIVEFGGEPLTKVELEQLFSNLLAGRASARSRELAVALNTASSFQPKWLCLDSYQDEKAWRLEVKAEEEQITELTHEKREFAHRVHFRDQPSLKVFKRFLNGVTKAHPEEDIVRKRCSLAPVPVLLPDDGDCRDFPTASVVTYLIWEHPDHPVPELDLPEGRGIREESPVDASFVLLLGPKPKVHFQVLGLDYEPPETVNSRSVWTLMIDNKAKRDLSFSGVLLDDEWRTKKEALKHAWDRLASQTVRWSDDIMSEPPDKWGQSFQRLAMEGESTVLLMPIFKTVAGDLASRIDILNQQKIFISTKDFENPLRSGERSFVISKESEALFEGRRLIPIEEVLAEQQVYFEKRARWEEEEPEVELETLFELGYLSKSGIAFGLQSSFSRSSAVSFYRENRHLQTLRPRSIPLGLRVAVNNDHFDMDNQWKSLLVDNTFKQNMKIINSEMEKFYEFLMERGSEHSDYVLQYLLYLKESGEKWESHASDLELSTASGERLTLRQYLTSENFLETSLRGFKSSMESLKRSTSKVLVSPRQVMLIRKLTS